MIRSVYNEIINVLIARRRGMAFALRMSKNIPPGAGGSLNRYRGFHYLVKPQLRLKKRGSMSKFRGIHGSILKG